MPHSNAMSHSHAVTVPPTCHANVPITPHLPGLRHRSLSNNQLSGDIPPSIRTLTSLETMDLENNRLGGTIPDSLSALTNLIYLSMGNNKLEGPIPAFPSPFTKIYALSVFPRTHLSRRSHQNRYHIFPPMSIDPSYFPKPSPRFYFPSLFPFLPPSLPPFLPAGCCCLTAPQHAL
ncbi:unnamed protein product [Closterium sp. NIES-53]